MAITIEIIIMAVLTMAIIIAPIITLVGVNQWQTIQIINLKDLTEAYRAENELLRKAVEKFQEV